MISGLFLQRRPESIRRGQVHFFAVFRQDHAVARLSRLDRHSIIQNIFKHSRRVTLHRVTPTAAACHFVPDHLSGPDVVLGQCREQPLIWTRVQDIQ